jgi:hypothetical protein
MLAGLLSRIESYFWKCGMSIATIDIQPRVKNVELTDGKLSVTIEDGRTVIVPLDWYPRLAHATEAELRGWRVFEDVGGRDIIFWESIDELIPVVAFLAGVPSRESKRSFERWLSERQSTIN